MLVDGYLQEGNGSIGFYDIRKNSPPYNGELVMDWGLLREGIGLRKVGKGEMERGSRGEKGSQVLWASFEHGGHLSSGC